MLVTGGFTLYGDAQLDLMNNDMIVRGGNVGTWNGTHYTGLTALIASGRNGGGWNGAGIITTADGAQSSNHTTLGIAWASEVLAASSGTIDGQTVTATDVL